MKRFAFALMIVALLLAPAAAFASHNGAVVTYATGACGETTFSAEIADPAGTHKVSNMYLVVDTEDGAAQYVKVPIDGSSATITVGPFYTYGGGNKTISWHVFGGGERSYDQPLWNGYGGPTFGADITAYAASVGGYGWVIGETDDPNPFVTWNTIDVSTCAIVKDMCKDGGWALLVDEQGNPFKNQGQCVSSIVSYH